MAPCELMSALDLLRQSRQKLISRTTGQTADLFSNLFLFEKNEVGLKLSFEKEKTKFINSHFPTSEGSVGLLLDSSLYAIAIKKLIFSLCEENSSKHEFSAPTAFYRDLNLTKIASLELLINIENKASANLSQLKYIMVKDDRIFAREIEKLLITSKGD